MNFRWSDFVAMSAITAGAIVPTAFLMSSRSDSAHHTYQVIELQSIHEGAEYEALTEEGYTTTFEVYQECVEDTAPEDATLHLQVRFLEEQVALQRHEIVTIREATLGVRDRIVGDIATTRAEMVLKPEMNRVVRLEFVERATQDLDRMKQAEALTEQAMDQAAQSLQERLVLLEAELNARQDDEQTKRRRHRRKGPPCRRPPTRRPDRRHPGR